MIKCSVKNSSDPSLRGLGREEWGAGKRRFQSKVQLSGWSEVINYWKTQKSGQEMV